MQVFILRKGESKYEKSRTLQEEFAECGGLEIAAWRASDGANFTTTLTGDAEKDKEYANVYMDFAETYP